MLLNCCSIINDSSGYSSLDYIYNWGYNGINWAEKLLDKSKFYIGCGKNSYGVFRKKFF